MLKRLAAAAVDGATYLIIPALLVPLGVFLVVRGISPPAEAVYLFSLAVVVLPATLWTARCEAETGATPGKRLLRLHVIDLATSRRPSRARALVRALVKIAVPWGLGHTVALGFAAFPPGGLPGWLLVVTILTYAWVIAALVLLFIRPRRLVHDRVVGTLVIGAPAGDSRPGRQIRSRGKR